MDNKNIKKWIDALLECQTMRIYDTRKQIIDQLPKKIRDRISHHHGSRSAVNDIVRTCLNYKNGLQELVIVVQSYEANSIPMARIHALLELHLDESEGVYDSDDRFDAPTGIFDKLNNTQKSWIATACGIIMMIISFFLWPASDPPRSQLVRWGPLDGYAAGMITEDEARFIPEGEQKDVRFIPWIELKEEIETKLLHQMAEIDGGSTIELQDFRDRGDWIVALFNPDGEIIGNVWLGVNPLNEWKYDGLIRVGSHHTFDIWGMFRRYSDGSYRKQ